MKHSCFFAKNSKLTNDLIFILFYPLIKSSNVSALMDGSYAKKRKTPREIIEDFKIEHEL